MDGDCGKGYTAIHPSSCDFLGFHGGTSGDCGIVVPIWKEDISHIRGQSSDMCFTSKLKVDDCHGEDAPFIPGLHIIGKLDRRVYNETQTQFLPSPIQDAMIQDNKVNVQPAMLTFSRVNGKVIDPWHNALHKFEERKPITDWSGYEYAMKNPEEVFEGFADINEKIKPYTMEQVLFGDPDNGIEALPCDTSVTKEFKDQGFEIRSQPLEEKPSNKKKLWNKHTREISSELVDSMNELHSNIVNDEVEVRSYSEACLKDELRDTPRVLAGKTRMFFVSSLTIAIMCCMYFKPIFDKMKKSMWDSSCKVGINPLGYEWKDLWAWLNEYDGKLIGSDCAGWDYSIWYFWTYLYGLWACHCYKVSPDSKLGKILMKLARTVVGCIFCRGGFAYLLERGVSSGHYCTSNFNTFVNYCVHKTIFNLKRPWTDMQFKDFVRFVAYGDDNLAKLKEEILEWYNMLVLAKAFATMFGMNYTTPGKDAVTKPWLTTEEITFLCRKFRPIEHEGANVAVAAPLDKESIYGMLAWIRTPKPQTRPDGTVFTPTVEHQLKENMKTALMEMSLYPKREYMKFVDELLKWCRKSHFSPPVIRSYEVENGITAAQYHYVPIPLANQQ